MNFSKTLQVLTQLHKCCFRFRLLEFLAQRTISFHERSQRTFNNHYNSKATRLRGRSHVATDHSNSLLHESQPYFRTKNALIPPNSQKILQNALSRRKILNERNTYKSRTENNFHSYYNRSIPVMQMATSQKSVEAI